MKKKTKTVKTKNITVPVVVDVINRNSVIVWRSQCLVHRRNGRKSDPAEWPGPHSIILVARASPMAMA